MNSYLYPDNLRAKATLWLWELRDIVIIGVGGILSVVSLAELGFSPPAVIVAVYAFLSIRFEDTSILNFLQGACAFFFFKQQFYEWRFGDCGEKSSPNRTRRNAVPDGS